MKKAQLESIGSQRVLARLLAKDLREVNAGVFHDCDCSGGGGGGATPTVTQNPTDITNVGADAD
jgi:hypothetical protein